MLWSQARVQQDTKENRIIVNLNRPAKMLSSFRPCHGNGLPGAHNLERATLTYSCQGVFTDHFIFSTVLARI